MPRYRAWLIVLPLALAGSELAHTMVNALVGSPTGPGGELFEGRGAVLVPALAAAGLAAVLLELGARLLSPAGHRREVSLLPFAFVAPAAFVLQEHLETFLHGGAIPLGTILEPTFLPGLGLQLPVALASYLVARVLLKLADGIRLPSARRPPVPRLAHQHVLPLLAHGETPSPRRISPAHSGRAPPARLIAAG